MMEIQPKALLCIAALLTAATAGAQECTPDNPRVAALEALSEAAQISEGGGLGIDSFADLVKLSPTSVRVTLPLLSGLGKPSFAFDMKVDRISKDRGVEGPVVGKFYYGHEHVYVHLTESQTGGISLRFIVPMGYGNGDGYERRGIPVMVDVLSEKVPEHVEDAGDRPR